MLHTLPWTKQRCKQSLGTAARSMQSKRDLGVWWSVLRVHGINEPAANGSCLDSAGGETWARPCLSYM